MTTSETVLKKLPPLAKPTSPRLAALIGFFTGGIGLAIYFRSLVDLLPVELVVTLVVIGALITGVEPVHALYAAAIAAAIVGGSYGFWRAQSSNRRLAAPRMPAGIVRPAG